MAIQQVQSPATQKRQGQSSLGTLSQIGQGAAAIGTLIGDPILAGGGTLVSLGAGALEQGQGVGKQEIGPIQGVQKTELNTAMERRMSLQQQNPMSSIDEGIQAIESLGLPDEQRRRLLDPLLKARSLGRA